MHQLPPVVWFAPRSTLLLLLFLLWIPCFSSSFVLIVSCAADSSERKDCPTRSVSPSSSLFLASCSNSGGNDATNDPSSSVSATAAVSTATLNTASVPTTSMLWFQHQISITAPSRGCHLITGDIIKAAGSDLQKIQIGMCNLFVQHTSASLTINENADPDVRRDMEVALNKLVPAQWNRDGTFRHTLEGDDDMPGHVKTSLMGVSLNVPIQNGRLALGTWQGIYLNEHRCVAW